ncbi:MAG: hypothetical protein E7365_05485 [Clostridiales bacterium]|nr:hypothetical protein [Clostridiales bacterium]
MTDKLIILNKLTDTVEEGFIKLEDGKTLTVAFKGEKGKYILLCDSTLKELYEMNHCRFLYEKFPKNAGIFLIKDDYAVLTLFTGDQAIIKKELKKQMGLEIKDNIIEQIDSETEPDIFNEEIVAEKKEPEYKETGYVLPEEFIHPPAEIPNSFFDCNKEKFNDLLYNNPVNESLMALIPESKWVDVLEENYTFGIIYDENNIPLYICYGFDLGWSEDPPKKLEGYSQWIPLDCSDPQNKGLWVIYINAQTGERLK